MGASGVRSGRSISPNEPALGAFAGSPAPDGAGNPIPAGAGRPALIGVGRSALDRAGRPGAATCGRPAESMAGRSDSAWPRGGGAGAANGVPVAPSAGNPTAGLGRSISPNAAAGAGAGAGGGAGTGAGGGAGAAAAFPSPSMVDFMTGFGGGGGFRGGGGATRVAGRSSSETASAGAAAGAGRGAGRGATGAGTSAISGAPRDFVRRSAGWAGFAPATAGSSAPGACTKKLVPHFGHRILRPVGGTRRSSTWYGALHPSHSTLNMGPAGSLSLAGLELKMSYNFKTLSVFVGRAHHKIMGMTV
jgi:hypothetical protein